MSKSYYNDISLKSFGPVIHEQGTHMIMSGVQKPLIERIVSVDTAYGSLVSEKITGVKQMEVDSVSIPFTFYNITATNNTFTVVKQGGATLILTLAIGYYATVANVVSAINTALSATYGVGAVVFSINSVTKKTEIACTANYTFTFFNGAVYKSLGYILGFRSDLLVFGSSFVSEAVAYLMFPRHLYLTINEWTNQSSNNFSVPTGVGGVLHKNIIARIAVPTELNFGSIINASYGNGLLVSETRKYAEKINVLRLELGLVDETGEKIGLNGADFIVNLRLLCE
jgi:hypothetical protein